MSFCLYYVIFTEIDFKTHIHMIHLSIVFSYCCSLNVSMCIISSWGTNILVLHIDQ